MVIFASARFQKLKSGSTSSASSPEEQTSNGSPGQLQMPLNTDSNELLRTNAASVRQIFRTAFARVNLPYVRPRSIRDTVTQLAGKWPETYSFDPFPVLLPRPRMTSALKRSSAIDRFFYLVSGARLWEQPGVSQDQFTATALPR